MNLIKLLGLIALMSIAGCGDKAEVVGPNALVTAYPNPMSNTLFVSINNGTGTPVQLVVFDPNGETVADSTVDTGSHNFRFDVADRPEGRYHVVCSAGGMKHTTEVLKR
jgi:hypothetical protein